MDALERLLHAGDPRLIDSIGILRLLVVVASLATAGCAGAAPSPAPSSSGSAGNASATAASGAATAGNASATAASGAATAGSASATAASGADSAGSGSATAAEPSPDGASSAAFTCSAEGVEVVHSALADVPSYSYHASGFIFAETFGQDPEQPPRTERVQAAYQGAYVAPDRALRRSTAGAAGPEPRESIAIGSDLWVRTSLGWQALPGATEPGRANELGTILNEAGSDWTAIEESDLPGTGCVLRAQAPTPAEGGVRETTIRVDEATGLPSAIRVELRGVRDPYGNRRDSRLDYEIRYDEAVSIQPPA